MPAAAARPPPPGNRRHMASAPVGARARRAHADRVAAVRVRREHRVREVGRRVGDLVAEDAAHAARPRLVGQDVDPGRRQRQRRPRLAREGGVAPPRLVDRGERGIGVDEGQGIGGVQQRPVELGRRHDRVGRVVAVRVVGEAVREVAQRGQPRLGKRERLRERVRRGRRGCRRTPRPPPRRDAARRGSGRRASRCRRPAPCRRARRTPGGPGTSPA